MTNVVLSNHFTTILTHVAYNVIQAWDGYHGDKLPPWEQADDKTKKMIHDRVIRVLKDPRSGDATFHNEWVLEQRDAGWQHGFTYNEEKKTDPYLVPFHLLPPEIQAKERMFRAVVIKGSQV